MVFGDCCETGTAGGGCCETIVVVIDRASSVVDSIVGDVRCAEMDEKVVVSPDARTLTSYLPGDIEMTETVAGASESASLCKAIVRSYTSPPNLRAVKDVHGDCCPADGGLLSRNATKRPACANTSGVGAKMGGNSSSKCF